MSDPVWEVYVYEGPSNQDGYGALLTVLPGWTTLSIAPLGGAVGAGTVSFPLSSPVLHRSGNTPETSPVLAKETLWQCRQDGKPVFEFLAQSVDRTTVAADETQTVTVSGPGTAQVLNWAMAMPVGWVPADGGFIGATGAVQDPFSEQDPVTGAFVLDTVLWNRCTPGACSITPGVSTVYNESYQPFGVDYGGPGRTAQPFASGGGGSVQVLMTPGGAYLGGGPFVFAGSSFSAQVTPAVPVTSGAPGTPLDNDLANGSDVTQLIIRPASGGGYAMIALSYSSFWCEFSGANGTVTRHTIGPGLRGGTGAYDSSFAQYWRISCDTTGVSGGYLFRFWTSGDGASWTLQFSWSPAAGWDPRQVLVFMGGFYNTTGRFGAYSAFQSLNGEISAGPDAGPVYISVPAMAVVGDQLAQAKARGTIPFVVPTWSAGADSGGTPWTDSWSVQVPAGTDLLSVTQNFAGAVDAGWYMEPGYKLTVSANPGRRLENSVIFHEGELSQSGRTQTRDQVYNVAATVDGAGMIWTKKDPASAAKWGQRETWVSSGGTVDAASAVNTAAAAVSQWGDEVDARVVQIPPNLPGKTVFRDIAVWDWIGIERGDFRQTDAVQVIGITVSVDQDGTEAHELVVNTYHQVLAQWFAYLMGKFGGQAASTLGSLPAGTTAGSAFSLARGASLLLSPQQLGSGSSQAASLGAATSLGAIPEVAAGQNPAVPGMIPGTLIQGGSIPASAVGFKLSDLGPSGISVFYQANPPPVAGITPGSIWYETDNGNKLYVYQGAFGAGVWTPTVFGAGAVGSISASSITSGTMSADLISGGTIVAATISGATITGAVSIAAPVITGGSLSSATIVGGSISAGSTFLGTNWEETILGEFFYTGTPGTGNLAVSIAPSGSGQTAWRGNSYKAGLAAYGTGNSSSQVYVTGGTPIFTMSTGLASEVTASSLFTQPIPSSVPSPRNNEYMQTVLRGPKSVFDGTDTTIYLKSAAADGSALGAGFLSVGTLNTLMWNANGITIPNTIQTGAMHVNAGFGWGGGGNIVADSNITAGGSLTAVSATLTAATGAALVVSGTTAIDSGGGFHGASANFGVGLVKCGQLQVAGSTSSADVGGGSFHFTGACAVDSSLSVGSLASSGGISCASIHSGGNGAVFDSSLSIGGGLTVSSGISANSLHAGAGGVVIDAGLTVGGTANVGAVQISGATAIDANLGYHGASINVGSGIVQGGQFRQLGNNSSATFGGSSMSLTGAANVNGSCSVGSLSCSGGISTSSIHSGGGGAVFDSSLSIGGGLTVSGGISANSMHAGGGGFAVDGGFSAGSLSTSGGISANSLHAGGGGVAIDAGLTVGGGITGASFHVGGAAIVGGLLTVGQCQVNGLFSLPSGTYAMPIGRPSSPIIASASTTTLSGSNLNWAASVSNVLNNLINILVSIGILNLQ